jgi:hypothetical protein
LVGDRVDHAIDLEPLRVHVVVEGLAEPDDRDGRARRELVVRRRQRGDDGVRGQRAEVAHDRHVERAVDRTVVVRVHDDVAHAVVEAVRDVRVPVRTGHDEQRVGRGHLDRRRDVPLAIVRDDAVSGGQQDAAAARQRDRRARARAGVRHAHLVDEREHGVVRVVGRAADDGRLHALRLRRGRLAAGGGAEREREHRHERESRHEREREPWNDARAQVRTEHRIRTQRGAPHRRR